MSNETEYGKLYYQTDQPDWDKIQEVLEEGSNVYLQEIHNAQIWMQVHNPDQSDYNQLKNVPKVIAFQHGKPTNPPPCPPGGCH